MTLGNLILVAGLVQAILLSMAIVAKKDKRKYPLLLLLVIIAFGLVLRISYSPAIYVQWVKVLQFSDLCFLLFGPAFWFFIKSVKQPVKRHDWKALIIHGVPALLFLIHYSIQILPLSNQEFMVAEQAGRFNLYYTIFLGTANVLNIVYWWYSLSIVRKTTWKNVKSKQFLIVVLVINALAILGWLVGYVLSFTGPQWYSWLYSAYQIAFISLAAGSIAISYHALSNTGFWLEEKKAKKYARSRLSDTDIKEIGQRLESYVRNEKKYLDPDFTLDQLSSSLKINKVQVSQVINQYKGKGFADWINEYRVNEFIKKAESGQYGHLTLLGIATESGFNTKATFNKAFKKAKGMTPSQYIGNNTSDGKPALSN